MHKQILFLILILAGLVAGCCPEPTPTPPPASCTAQSLPAEASIPPVTEADHVHGPADAPITIIEYADFQ